MMTALGIAEYVLGRCTELGHPINNIKLQRILYFLYGEYYKTTGKEIFQDRFIAGKLGPMVRCVYHKYSKHVTDPICIYNENRFDFKNLNPNLFDEILDEYCLKTDWDLVHKSQQTKPWLETQYNQVIDSRKIKKYFQERK